MGGVAARGGPPCHKGFECTEDGTYVKFEFVVEEDGDVVDCYFEEETDTGLVEITGWESKDGEDCEPVSVEWKSDGYAATTVTAYGGKDCDSVDDPDGSFTPELENGGGNVAAISNLQFCVEEETETLPQCPVYGTSRSDPTAIFSIRYDSDADELVEDQVGVIPDESSNSNYPNGIAFDPDDDVWYFAEEDGSLKTMNEDGSFGIKEYGAITDGAPVAGATFHEGEYHFIPNGGSTLETVDARSDANYGTGTAPAGGLSPVVVTGLDWSGVNLGDLAIDRDAEILYVSTTNSNAGPIFFSVDLNDLSDQNLIADSSDGDRTEYAIQSQIAFENDTLWAHNAGTGNWRTVDVSDGSLSDVVGTTNEYTDLAQCGFYGGGDD